MMLFRLFVKNLVVSNNMYDLDDYLRYCLLLLIPTGSDRMYDALAEL